MLKFIEMNKVNKAVYLMTCPILFLWKDGKVWFFHLFCFANKKYLPLETWEGKKDRIGIWIFQVWISILSSDPQSCPDPDQDPQKGFRSRIFRSFSPILQYIGHIIQISFKRYWQNTHRLIFQPFWTIEHICIIYVQ